MDILAHMIWTNYGSRSLNKKLKKKNKKTINIKMAMFWSIFPDIFAFGIPMLIMFFVSIFSGNFNIKSLLNHHLASNILVVDLPSYLYQFSHSIIIWVLIFILVWIIWKKPYYVLFGWAFHIFIDIFSHEILFYPTPFLFPISEWVFPYGVKWNNPYFMIVNYSLIAILAVYFYLTRSKKTDS